MAKTSPIESTNLGHFMQAMSRVLGISRRRLEKIMFQGLEAPRIQRRSITRRRGSKFAAK